MSRKLDWSLLLLSLAFVLGTGLRFWPNIANGFPTLDGGMFYVMAGELRMGHFVLPQYTSYNHANIPYTYPPLGFYIAALLSILSPTSSTLWIFLYIPALISVISIFFFYKLAGEILHSRLSASLATLVYALSSRTFLWEIMGGGITRALGKLFLLLMMWQAIVLFRTIKHRQDNVTNGTIALNYRHLLLVIIYGAAVIMSHPPAALHAVLAGCLIFLLYGRTRRGLVTVLQIGTGVALVSMAWWSNVLLHHGIRPFIYAAQTSKHSLDHYQAILKLYNPFSDYLILPTLLFLSVGLLASVKQRNYFIVIWIVAAYLVDARGAEFVVPIAESLLTGLGIFGFLTWISHTDNTQVTDIFIKPLNQAIVFILIPYFAIVASGGIFQLLNTSLKPADLKMINWVSTNIDKNKSFLLITGRQYSMSDPMQEWFPALTNQHSATTLQGMEWTLGKNFFPWLDQLTTIQQCANANCIDIWSTRNKVEYDYVIVTIPDATDQSKPAVSLRNLAVSMRNSSIYSLIHNATNSLIFKLVK